jgi:hypothetical protein
VLIFFGTLGIKNIYFIHRLRLHYLLAFALQGIALFAFLLADKSELFLIKSLLLALASFFVWRDFFGNVAGEGVENESSCIALQFPGVVSGIAAYAMLQVAWAAQLLPIGIVYGGYIAALAAFSMTNLYFHYLQGTLTRAMVLTRVTILLLAGTFIFAVASLVA